MHEKVRWKQVRTFKAFTGFLTLFDGSPNGFVGPHVQGVLLAAVHDDLHVKDVILGVVVLLRHPMFELQPEVETLVSHDRSSLPDYLDQHALIAVAVDLAVSYLSFSSPFRLPDANDSVGVKC